MARLETTYEPESVTTRADIAGGGGSGFGMDYGGFGKLLGQIAERRAWEREQQMAAAEAERRAAAEEAAWRRQMAEREFAAREKAQRAAGRAAKQQSQRAIEQPRDLSLQEMGKVDQQMTPYGLVKYVDPTSLPLGMMERGMGGVYGSPQSPFHRPMYAGGKTWGGGGGFDAAPYLAAAGGGAARMRADMEKYGIDRAVGD